MFIHFDSDKAAECDNCGKRGTIMHMSIMRVDQTVNLCIVCFEALAQAISHASQKLIDRPIRTSKESEPGRR